MRLSAAATKSKTGGRLVAVQGGSAGVYEIGMLGAEVLAAAAREADGATFAVLALTRQENRRGLSEAHLEPSEKVERILKNELPHWKREASPLPTDSGKARIELVRQYTFPTFRAAISKSYDAFVLVLDNKGMMFGLIE